MSSPSVNNLLPALLYADAVIRNILRIEAKTNKGSIVARFDIIENKPYIVVTCKGSGATRSISVYNASGHSIVNLPSQIVWDCDGTYRVAISAELEKYESKFVTIDLNASNCKGDLLVSDALTAYLAIMSNVCESCRFKSAKASGLNVVLIPTEFGVVVNVIATVRAVISGNNKVSVTSPSIKYSDGQNDHYVEWPVSASNVVPGFYTLVPWVASIQFQEVG